MSFVPNPVPWVKQLSSYTQCICKDCFDDPAWFAFDCALRTQFSSNLHMITTQTLLDWTCEPHKTFLEQWSVKRHNQSFKDYVYKKMIHVNKEELHAHDCLQNTKQPRSACVSTYQESVKHNDRSIKRSRSATRTRHTRTN